MNVTELERDIKKELRASMNGILSARMREAGMPYKLIFGVELPRLQSIANEFPHDSVLANQLWSRNIREAKLLAIMLMPPEDFTLEIANTWAETMVTAEEAQILAMILLPKTKQAKEICKVWLERGNALQANCACLCLRHLLMKGEDLSTEEQIFNRYKEKTTEANLHLRKAIQALTEAFNAKKETQNVEDTK
ncbi:MAG: DNA alkylation repair protein [Bacteroidaceae bacterium]|nr:DNA alkylation repair protein [Bacteroidaceae bacterium]